MGPTTDMEDVLKIEIYVIYTFIVERARLDTLLKRCCHVKYVYLLVGGAGGRVVGLGLQVGFGFLVGLVRHVGRGLCVGELVDDLAVDVDPRVDEGVDGLAVEVGLRVDEAVDGLEGDVGLGVDEVVDGLGVDEAVDVG